MARLIPSPYVRACVCVDGHSGLTGPATGWKFANLKREFIEKGHRPRPER